MQAFTRKQRGGPIHVRSAGTTISLVPQVAVREWHFGPSEDQGGAVLKDIAPDGVYVIDSAGVRKLDIPDETGRALKMMILVALAGPLLFWLFTRRGKK